MPRIGARSQPTLMIRVERICPPFGHRVQSPVVSELRLAKTSRPVSMGHACRSPCDFPIHVKVDMEWADLDVFVGLIFGVLRRL
jgi:hypothetical protein